jgi:hypothetical protein
MNRITFSVSVTGWCSPKAGRHGRDRPEGLQKTMNGPKNAVEGQCLGGVRLFGNAFTP